MKIGKKLVSFIIAVLILAALLIFTRSGLSALTAGQTEKIKVKFKR